MLHVNLSFYFSIIYFFFYSCVLFSFCIIFIKNLKNTSSIYSLIQNMEYSKSSYYLFLLTTFTALGVPPTVLFAPKFAGLTIVFFNSSWLIFLYVLFITFLSFALYLQIFDGLFSKKKLHFLKTYHKTEIKSKKQTKKHVIKKFSFLFLTIFLFSFIFFKDFVLFLFLFF